MRVFLAQIRDLRDAERLIGALPAARRAEILAYRSAQDRARSAVGEALMRLSLSACTGVPPQALDIVRTSSGKPYLPGGPHFSLSHSGEAVAFALSDMPIGVDVEELVPRRVSAIIGRWPEAERREIGSDPDPLAAFYRHWTARESALKRLGLGLGSLRALGLEGNAVLYAGERLSVRHYLADGYVLAVCTEEEGALCRCPASDVAAAYLARCGG